MTATSTKDSFELTLVALQHNGLKSLNATVHWDLNSLLPRWKIHQVPKNHWVFLVKKKIAIALLGKTTLIIQHFFMVKCPYVHCGGRGKGKERGTNRSMRIVTLFFLTSSFRLPSLPSSCTPVGTGYINYTTLETSHVKITCLQAGRCNVKGEKTSISVGQER